MKAPLHLVEYLCDLCGIALTATGVHNNMPLGWGLVATTIGGEIMLDGEKRLQDTHLKGHLCPNCISKSGLKNLPKAK